MESAPDLALGQSPGVADIEEQKERGLRASVLPHESRKPAAEREAVTRNALTQHAQLLAARDTEVGSHSRQRF